MIFRFLLAFALFAVGAAVTAFGVMTAIHRDPLGTTLILFGVGLLLLAGALRLVLRRRR